MTQTKDISLDLDDTLATSKHIIKVFDGKAKILAGDLHCSLDHGCLELGPQSNAWPVMLTDVARTGMKVYIYSLLQKELIFWHVKSGPPSMTQI